MRQTPPQSCVLSPVQVILQSDAGAISGVTPPAKPVPQWHSLLNSTPAKLNPLAAHSVMQDAGVSLSFTVVTSSAMTRSGTSTAHASSVTQFAGRAGEAAAALPVKGVATTKAGATAADATRLRVRNELRIVYASARAE
jgi:hypothetical protein